MRTHYQENAKVTEEELQECKYKLTTNKYKL